MPFQIELGNIHIRKASCVKKNQVPGLQRGQSKKSFLPFLHFESSRWVQHLHGYKKIPLGLRHEKGRNIQRLYI